MAAVIDVQGVVKRFGSTIALDGLDLQVEAGEVHAFLGPNGAGKTTTLRVLLGQLRIDAGHMTLLGRDPWADAVELHKDLAYVPGEVNLWPQLSGEVIDLLGRLRGAGPEAATTLRGSVRARPDEEGPDLPRATARRLPWLPPWPVMCRCCCSTSRPPGWTRSWMRAFASACTSTARQAARFC